MPSTKQPLIRQAAHAPGLCMGLASSPSALGKHCSQRRGSWELRWLGQAALQQRWSQSIWLASVLKDRPRILRPGGAQGSSGCLGQAHKQRYCKAAESLGFRFWRSACMVDSGLGAMGSFSMQGRQCKGRALRQRWISGYPWGVVLGPCGLGRGFIGLAFGLGTPFQKRPG